MAISLLVAIQFVTLHGPDGQIYLVNPENITTLREPIGWDVRHFAKGVHCVVVTVNGKFLAVVEHCAEVRDIISHMH